MKRVIITRWQYFSNVNNGNLPLLWLKIQLAAGKSGLGND